MLQVSAEFKRQYLGLAHGIQSAIAWTLCYDDSLGTPKHLRVGVDLQKAEHGALVNLLIGKNLITSEEYQQAVIKGLEEELAMQTQKAKSYGDLPSNTTFK